jgi:ribosomal protein S2
MRTKDNEHLSRYYTNKSIRERIDKLLEKHSSLEATLGTDSTRKEISNVTRQQVELEKKIKEIDPEYWDSVFKVIKD